MSTELELVVRREHAIFTPSYRVTVAALGPIHVLESFGIQTRDGLAVAVAHAMEQLRAKGYRLTEPVALHETYASAHMVKDEREEPTVVVGGNLVADARAIARALQVIDTHAGAQEVVRLVADLMAGAQALKARADAVLHSDSRVESAAILDDALAAVAGDDITGSEWPNQT